MLRVGTLFLSRVAYDGRSYRCSLWFLKDSLWFLGFLPLSSSSTSSYSMTNRVVECFELRRSRSSTEGRFRDLCYTRAWCCIVWPLGHARQPHLIYS